MSQFWEQSWTPGCCVLPSSPRPKRASTGSLRSVGDVIVLCWLLSSLVSDVSLLMPFATTSFGRIVTTDPVYAGTHY